MAPVVDRLEQSYNNRVDFRVYKTMDQSADQNKFASQHGVSAVPSMVLVKADGSELQRWTGTQSEDLIASALDASAP